MVTAFGKGLRVALLTDKGLMVLPRCLGTNHSWMEKPLVYVRPVYSKMYDYLKCGDASDRAQRWVKGPPGSPTAW